LASLLLLPFIIFGAATYKNAHDRPNRRAVRVGYLLFAISLILLFSGVALMRVEGFEIRNPNARSVAYWAHVITPLLAVWLYILHRLAGPRIKWKVGAGLGGRGGCHRGRHGRSSLARPAQVEPGRSG
jgi:hypothetical protein